MQWYLTKKKRLILEIELMESKGVNFQLCRNDRGDLLWRGPLCVSSFYHDDVRLVYPEHFPYKPMDVYVLKPSLPLSNLHVYHDGRICYLRPEEWSPNWTAYEVYLTTIRFLHDFYSGEMDDYLP
jgi:ubiquitin-protein ligase